MELAKREAMELRGRFGVDVWEQYVNLSGGKQYDFLTRQGVPESRILMTHPPLNKILITENILA